MAKNPIPKRYNRKPTGRKSKASLLRNADIAPRETASKLPPEIASDGTHTWTLDDSQRAQICTWLGCFLTQDQIVTKVHEEWGKIIGIHVVRYYANAKRWQPMIARARTEWMKQVGDVPISNQRIRMERLEGLYQKAISGREDHAAARQEALRILNSARQEMEEATQQTTNVYMTSIQNYGDDELLKRYEEVKQRLKSLNVPMPRRLVPPTPSAMIEQNAERFNKQIIDATAQEAT